MAQTAVEWYEVKIKQLDFFIETKQITWKEYYNKKDKLFEQAKAMGKQQMIDFAKQWESRQNDGNLDTIEMLYEQTYNK